MSVKENIRIKLLFNWLGQIHDKQIIIYKQTIKITNKNSN